MSFSKRKCVIINVTGLKTLTCGEWFFLFFSFSFKEYWTDFFFYLFVRRLPSACAVRGLLCTLGVLCDRLRVVDAQAAKRAREAWACTRGGERQQPVGATATSVTAAAQGQPRRRIRARQADGQHRAGVQRLRRRPAEGRWWGGGRTGAVRGVVWDRGQQEAHPKVLESDSANEQRADLHHTQQQRSPQSAAPDSSQPQRQPLEKQKRRHWPRPQRAVCIDAIAQTRAQREAYFLTKKTTDCWVWERDRELFFCFLFFVLHLLFI